jgi:hypothetical protein
VVGPVCESGDYLALGRDLPRSAGRSLAVMTAGAYGAVQAGTYNTRRLVPEVLVKDEAFAVVRPRPSYEDLIGLDRCPTGSTDRAQAALRSRLRGLGDWPACGNTPPRPRPGGPHRLGDPLPLERLDVADDRLDRALRAARRLSSRTLEA